MILGGIIIPNIMAIAFERKLFDEADERKIHRGIVPRLGGISFLPSFTFSFCIVIGFNFRFNMPEMSADLSSSIIPVFFLICALMLMYLVGIADDLIGVRYRAKFLFQIIAGALMVLSGCWIYNLFGFLGIGEWPTILGWAATILLVIYVINAVNLIDGIDGLASGLSGIALIFYSWVFFRSEEYTYALLAGATLGTLVPFFYYNVFGSPERHTKIFMGDTGSLTIGTMLAFLSIRVLCIGDPSPLGGSNLLVLSLAPILVPCFDVARVFFHRVRKGRNPFLPDRCHIHHKLLALGCRQWQALLAILAADAVLVGINLILAPRLGPTWIIAGDVVLWIAFNIVLTRIIRRKEQECGIELYN